MKIPGLALSLVGGGLITQALQIEHSINLNQPHHGFRYLFTDLYCSSIKSFQIIADFNNEAILFIISNIGKG